MKRFFALLLAGVMSVSVLAGCGGDNASTTKLSKEKQENSHQAANNTSTESYNVVMQWPTVGEAPAGLQDVEKAINAITEPEIGVTVTLEPVNAFNLANETALTISSGDKLDLCLSLLSGVGSLVNTGAIIPLDDLYAKYGSDIKEDCGIRIKGGYHGDTLYSIPIAYTTGEKFGYVCRTDMLDKYGITIDENKVYSWEELGEIFAKVKEGEGSSFYCIGGTSKGSDLFNTLYAYDALGASAASGVLMLGDEFTSTTVVNLYETEEYKKFAETMYDWAQKGYFSADASTNTEAGQEMVKGGNYLGWFPGTCSGGADDFTAMTGMDMTVITTVPGCSVTSLFTSILWSIPTTSENPEKAMEFLNYMYKDSRISTLLQCGIEGQDYVIVEQNEMGTLIDTPEGLDSDTITYSQRFGVYGNRLEWPIFVPNSIDYNDRMKKFSDTVKNISPALGYNFIIDNVSSEYSAVSSVISQYQGILNCGAVDPAIELKEFNQALKDAGIDKVIAENQRQLNNWLKNNK